MSNSDEFRAYDRDILDIQIPGTSSETNLQQRRIIETHISWVLLTGEQAYKFKKPVKYDFLDYSTAEKRRINCELEVQRNAIWSGDLYIDVVAIIRQSSGLVIAPGDHREFPQAVDYAVRMKQFPQQSLLQSTLERGEMSADQIERLAEWLVNIQRQLAPVSTPAEQLWEHLRHATLENFEYLEAMERSGEIKARIGRLHAWTLQQLKNRKQDFFSRVELGKIVAGHGDLHLGNILFWDNQFFLFDAIEFNQSLFEIDTINEIAFLVMELSEHSYREQSHRLRNHFAEMSSDYDGLSWLRFYMVYRAMVRAKVDCIRMSQQPSRDNDFSTAGLAYLEYAERQIAERTSKLWITMGLSGSGKSYRARQIVDRHGFIRLRSDVVRKQIYGLDPHRQSDRKQWTELYSAEASQKTFESLSARAKQLLQNGFDVIVDATFLKRKYRQPFQVLAQELGAEFGIVSCSAPIDELSRRIRHRSADPSDATTELLPEQIASMEPLTADEIQFLLPNEIFA